MAIAEVLNGPLRAAWLVPLVGDWRARQVGALLGAGLVLLLACITARWLAATSRPALLAVGVLWLTLMLAFEMLRGRLIAGYGRTRILADYDLPHGGLPGLAMSAPLFGPLLAARLRHLGPYAAA